MKPFVGRTMEDRRNIYRFEGGQFFMGACLLLMWAALAAWGSTLRPWHIGIVMAVNLIRGVLNTDDEDKP